MRPRGVETKPMKIDEPPRLESMLTGAITLHASSQLRSRRVLRDDGSAEQKCWEFTQDDLDNQYDDINREIMREGFRPLPACFYPPNQGFDSPPTLDPFPYHKIGFTWFNNNLTLLTPGAHLRGLVEDTPGPMASDEFFDTLLNYAQIYGRRFEQKRVFIEYFNKIGWLDVDYTGKGVNIFKEFFCDDHQDRKITSGWETATGDDVYTPPIGAGTTFRVTIGEEEGYHRRLYYIPLTPDVRRAFPGFLIPFALIDDQGNRYEDVHVTSGKLGVAKIGSSAGKRLIGGLGSFYSTHPSDMMGQGTCLDFEVVKVPTGPSERYEYRITAITGRAPQ